MKRVVIPLCSAAWLVLCLSQSVFAAPKPTGQSVEASIAFVREKLMACHQFTDRTTTFIQPNVLSSKSYTWKKFFLEDDLSGTGKSNWLEMEMQTSETVSMNKAGERFPANVAHDPLLNSLESNTSLTQARKNISKHDRVNLSQISTVVAAKKAEHAERYNVVMSSYCQDSSCSPRRFTLETCFRTKAEAQRIAKALIHAITLAGGKKPMF